MPETDFKEPLQRRLAMQAAARRILNVPVGRKLRVRASLVISDFISRYIITSYIIRPKSFIYEIHWDLVFIGYSLVPLNDYFSLHQAPDPLFPHSLIPNPRNSPSYCVLSIHQKTFSDC